MRRRAYAHADDRPAAAGPWGGAGGLPLARHPLSRTRAADSSGVGVVLVLPATASRIRRTAVPPGNDASKIVPTFRPPGRVCRATAAMPAEAMQPQSAQSGVPPSWHGVMGCVRSAERHVVVFAKMHSSGVLGGSRYAFRRPSRIPSFG